MAVDKARVLLVEDNEKILRGNKRMMEWKGYSVDTATTLADARTRLASGCIDVIVLDVMMPDGNGLDFLRDLRESQWSSIPVLLLTGLTAQDDIVRGLNNGGDDYLTKPYDFSILLARVEALLRRSQRVPATITMDRLTLDVAACMAMLDGVDLLLTQKEFALLLIFAQNCDRFIDGKYLYEKVWKQPLTQDNRVLKTTIARLRTKIFGSGWRIDSSRGEGYCLGKE